jgi:hypothetical protein
VSQNPSWRHHYIPEFYLKQWAADDGRLVEFSKPWGDIVKPKRVYPRQTGFEDRLNELAGLPESERQRLETHFYSPVDSAAASVLHALKGGRLEFNKRERRAWTRFLTSLILRNPENIRAATDRIRNTFAMRDPGIEQRYQALRAPDDPETFSEFSSKVDLSDDFARTAKEAMTIVIEDGLVVNHISHMQWGVIQLPFGAPPLLTSDRPMFITKPLPDPECEVLMPLGPKFLFFAVNNKEFAHKFATLSPSEVATASNDIVVCRAQKYVYAMSDRHLAYVQANMGTAEEVPIAAAQFSRSERRRRARLYSKLVGSKRRKRE